VESAPVIIFVGVLIFLAHFFVVTFERTRVPDVLFLIGIGLLLGPVFRVVSPNDFGKMGPIFTEIALVVILFEGGLEISFGTLRSSFRGTLGLTLLSYVISLVLLSSVLYVLTSLSLLESVFAGAVLAAPAPSVVIPIARQLRLGETPRTVLMLESPLGEALGIVVALAILESFKISEIKIGRILGTLLSSFMFAVLIGGIGGFAWSVLLHRMRKLQHGIFTTAAYVFILFGVAEFLGFSGPVAALTSGIVLGNAELIRIGWWTKRMSLMPLQHNETEKLFIGEVVFLIKTFFFVYLGLSISFTDIISMGIALLLTAVLLLSRIIAVQYSLDRKGTKVQEASLVATLVPKGTAAVVLASLPIQMGIPGAGAIQHIIYGVVIFSIVGSAILVFLVERTAVAGIFHYFMKMYSRPEESPGLSVKGLEENPA
jgi:cell volume regulation protein A